MSLSSRVVDLAARIALEVKAVRALANGKAAASHTHSGSDITSGTIAAERLPFEVASGRVSISPSGAGVATGVVVTFPVGRFSATPNVAAAALASDPLTTQGSAHTVSTTQCTVVLQRASSTSSASIMWVAASA